MKRLKYNWLIIFLFISLTGSAQEKKEKLVYKLNIKEEITKATWRQTQQAFDAAQRRPARQK